MEEFDDGGDHGKERMLEARNLVKDLHAGSSFLPVAVSSKSPGDWTPFNINPLLSLIDRFIHWLILGMIGACAFW